MLRVHPAQRVRALHPEGAPENVMALQDQAVAELKLHGVEIRLQPETRVQVVRQVARVAHEEPQHLLLVRGDGVGQGGHEPHRRHRNDGLLRVRLAPPLVVDPVQAGLRDPLREREGCEEVEAPAGQRADGGEGLAEPSTEHRPSRDLRAEVVLALGQHAQQTPPELREDRVLGDLVLIFTPPSDRLWWGLTLDNRRCDVPLGGPPKVADKVGPGVRLPVLAPPLLQRVVHLHRHLVLHGRQVRLLASVGRHRRAPLI
mmetsp:Transcript_31624/g.94179  ORF Transcript_31624/g.94179 Transcript_31624/m.94179 type:complete len:258 (-) Transcript_31624:196-969(-)